MNATQPPAGHAECIRQMRFLACVIHELTETARNFYDQPDQREAMVQVNEAIHTLSGQLRDLTDPPERPGRTD